jgi:hypothetical protein
VDFLSFLSISKPTMLFSGLESAFLAFLFLDLDPLNPFMGVSISSLDFTQ